MTTLHYFIAGLETGLSINMGCLYEDDDNNGDVGDSEDARDMISAIFQEHLCDRWNLKYLDQLSTYYLRLGLARSVTHTIHIHNCLHSRILQKYCYVQDTYVQYIIQKYTGMRCLLTTWIFFALPYYIHLDTTQLSLKRILVFTSQLVRGGAEWRMGWHGVVTAGPVGTRLGQHTAHLHASPRVGFISAVCSRHALIYQLHTYIHAKGGDFYFTNSSSQSIFIS